MDQVVPQQWQHNQTSIQEIFQLFLVSLTLALYVYMYVCVSGVEGIQFWSCPQISPSVGNGI